MSDQTPQDPGQYPPPPPPQQQPWAPAGQQPGYVPGQPYPPQPGYGYPPVTAPPATSQATTALVLGIAGVVCCWGVLSIPAWVIGRKAVKEIDASQGQLGGRSSAQAGYILGIIGTVFAAVAVVVITVAIVLAVATTSISCTTSSTDTSKSVHCS